MNLCRHESKRLHSNGSKVSIALPIILGLFWKPLVPWPAVNLDVNAAAKIVETKVNSTYLPIGHLNLDLATHQNSLVLAYQD